jgi:rSAM/selenodomain-associated transferase 1
MRVLGIYVKQPIPGHVKTRLAKTVGDEKAAEIYEAFLSDLIERFRHTADRRFLCYAPRGSEVETWFADLGDLDYELWPQPKGTLEPRLRNFFNFAQKQGAEKTVVLGSDSPTLPLAYVDKAFQLLNLSDCVLGPATDGGYYLLGLRKPLPIFSDIGWSSPQVLSQTIARLADIPARLRLLPPWYDVDQEEDLDLLQGHIQAMALAQDPVVNTLAHTQRALEQRRR